MSYFGNTSWGNSGNGGGSVTVDTLHANKIITTIEKQFISQSKLEQIEENTKRLDELEIPEALHWGTF